MKIDNNVEAFQTAHPVITLELFNQGKYKLLCRLLLIKINPEMFLKIYEPISSKYGIITVLTKELRLHCLATE